MSKDVIDICPDLHAMSDMGHGASSNGEKYSRSHTYTMECYAQVEGRSCKRRGRCLINRTLNSPKSFASERPLPKQKVGKPIPPDFPGLFDLPDPLRQEILTCSACGNFIKAGGWCTWHFNQVSKLYREGLRKSSEDIKVED